VRIIDVGSGAPLVRVPGTQGGWEWVKPAVDALAGRCRVVTFSLADEPTCGGRFDREHGFDCYVDQVRDAMDLAGVEAAVVGGVSYGGLVAAAFAARYPRRASGLVLVSALPPQWAPDARARFYLAAPRLLSPLFFINSLRLYREIAAAVPGVIPGMTFALRHSLTVLTHMFSPARMARRVRLLESVDVDHELRAVHVPTLVVTGDAALDKVVPVELTEEYVRLWPHADRVTIARTGHLGLITRPDDFAAAVASFVERHASRTGASSGREKRVG
jgi:pimeloyl-ACP methyl ester carboxylesterase